MHFFPAEKHNDSVFHCLQAPPVTVALGIPPCNVWSPYYHEKKGIPLLYLSHSTQSLSQASILGKAFISLTFPRSLVGLLSKSIVLAT